MAQIYTLGYQKRSIEEFVELLLEAKIDVLIDVREKAWSHKPGFSKTAFALALENVGIEYIHAPFAGNPKVIRAQAKSHEACLKQYKRYLERRPEIVDEFDELVSELHRRGKRVCITCFERHPEDCHRSILADSWGAPRKARVEHLHPMGCPRLVPV